jgi:hypothetical protein
VCLHVGCQDVASKHEIIEHAQKVCHSHLHKILLEDLSIHQFEAQDMDNQPMAKKLSGETLLERIASIAI